jgi:hypothetical protein
MTRSRRKSRLRLTSCRSNLYVPFSHRGFILAFVQIPLRLLRMFGVLSVESRRLYDSLSMLGGVGSAYNVAPSRLSPFIQLQCHTFPVPI